MFLFCTTLMIGGITFFISLFLLGWLEESLNTKSGIKWSRELKTTINWELSLHQKCKEFERSKRSREKLLRGDFSK